MICFECYCILYIVHVYSQHSTIRFLFPYEFRKGYIVINRGPLIVNNETGEEEFDQKTCIRGRVIDRVFPGGKLVKFPSLSINIRSFYRNTALKK